MAENPKTMPLTFGLTLTLHVTLLRKCSVLIRIVLEKACDRRLARPSAIIGSGNNRGVNITPAMRAKLATPAGRGLIE